MNMFGFTMFNRDVVAAGVAERAKRDVRLARMNWHADSFHIYGKDIHAAQQRLFDRIKTTTFDERVYHFADPMIQDIYKEAEAVVVEKIREFDAR
jgi:thymidylate synthase